MHCSCIFVLNFAATIQSLPCITEPLVACITVCVVLSNPKPKTLGITGWLHFAFGDSRLYLALFFIEIFVCFVVKVSLICAPPWEYRWSLRCSETLMNFKVPCEYPVETQSQNISSRRHKVRLLPLLVYLLCLHRHLHWICYRTPPLQTLLYF